MRIALVLAMALFVANLHAEEAAGQWMGLIAGANHDAAVAAVKSRRPQDELVARSPHPYTDREVVIVNERAHVKLAGTLSVPNGKGPFPAVLLIAAAGRVDRSENAAGHLVFVVLADYLLRRGIAVLRYDKRGVGASTGDFGAAGLGDLVDDAVCAFRYLRARAEVDARRVGTIGHSEGGTLATAVASVDEHVAFVVAMAGSGLTGPFRYTNAAGFQAQERGASSEQVENIRALARQIFATVAATPDDAVADSRVSRLIDESVAARKLTSAQGDEVRKLLPARVAREELTDDPLRFLKKVKVPVLGLVGSLDRTMPAEPYVEAMRPVLASIPGSRVQVLPNLNHVMQTAKTGSPSEFGTIEETISPVALQTIGDWVEQRVKPGVR